MSIFSGKRGRQGAMAAAGQLQAGANTAYDALDTGFDRASEQYGKAGATLGGLVDSYGKGSTLFQDALGVNGAEASNAARSAYTASPGYQWSMDQGLQALARARAVNGTLDSGGADADAMTFATGLASKDYGGWLDRLSGLDTKRYGATTAQAGTFGDLGKLAYGAGAAKAGVAQQTGRDIASTTIEGFKAGDRADQAKFGAIMGGLNLVSQVAGSALGGGYNIFGGSQFGGGGWGSG